MSPKELTAFRMAPEVMEAARELKDREGIPVAVQIDKAMRDWLKKKGVKVRLGKPAATKKKG